ncbi:MAG: sodium-independent anion transporter, partial [Frankiaceae bacterium]
AAFLDDVTALTATGDPPSWFCLDGAAIGDVDYTAAAVLFRVHEQLQSRGTRLVVSNLILPVRRQLDRYGVTAAVGPGAYFATAGEALEAYRASKQQTDGQ